MNITSGKQCTGCGACVMKCPKQCIKMIEDDNGFLIPHIDLSLCVKCGLCDKVCHLSYKPELSENRVAYAATNTKSRKVLNESSSGGIFTLLAEEVINQGGIVFGVELNNAWNVSHIAIDSVDGLWKLRGSKYVQSSTGDTYLKAEDALKQGITVLYSGTPCQIAGLKKFLSKDYENLYTVEVMCHGVASGKLFKLYIKWLEEKYNDKGTKYIFRSKRFSGWGHEAEFNCGRKVYKISADDPYIKCFMSGISLREECYSCQYTGIKRVADITIGDFWGIQREYPQWFDKNGVSAVLVNSMAGQRLIDLIRDTARFNEVSTASIAKYNECLRQPAKYPENRKDFYSDIDKLGVEFIISKMLIHITRKDKILSLIPAPLKAYIKRLRHKY